MEDDSHRNTPGSGWISADGSPCNSSTGAFDCIRPHFNDVVEFLADVHTLSKLKVNLISSHLMDVMDVMEWIEFKSNGRLMSPGPGLDEDTVGGTLKAGIGQLLALEFVRGNGKDNRCINRYMPWLFHPPSTIQQGLVLFSIVWVLTAVIFTTRILLYNIICVARCNPLCSKCG